MAKSKVKDIERGSAAMLITLKNGTITIRHTNRGGPVLAKLKDAPEGTWSKIWENFKQLGIERCFEA